MTAREGVVRDVVLVLVGAFIAGAPLAAATASAVVERDDARAELAACHADARGVRESADFKAGYAEHRMTVALRTALWSRGCTDERAMRLQVCEDTGERGLEWVTISPDEATHD